MGVTYNPRIVTDGLVLALDAGNIKSYDKYENIHLYSNSLDVSATPSGYGGGYNQGWQQNPGDITKLNDGYGTYFTTTYSLVWSAYGMCDTSASTVYTVSFYAKSNTVANIRPRLYSNVNGTVSTGIYQSLQTGGVSDSGGWRKFTFFMPSTSNTGNSLIIELDTGTGFDIKNIQVEKGSTATDYYPTTTTAKNRGTTLTDLSARGNNGTLTNGPTFSNSNGGSLVFDGIDDTLPTLLSTNTLNNITQSVWFKWNGTNQSSAIIYLGNSNSNGFGLYIGSSGTPSNLLGVLFGGSLFNALSSSVTLTTNWTNFVITRDSTTTSLYQNGSLFDSTTNTPLTSASYPFIGNFNAGGNISNISFYNRALTAAEIRQNYIALKNKFILDGSLSNPFESPVQAQSLGFSAGTYYFKSGETSSAQLLEYQPNYYESKPFCCVFRSSYASTATTNKIDLSIPMAGLLVQRDTLDLRGAVYWSSPITYTTVGGSGNNTADSGTGYAGSNARRVILGNAGGHGLYNTGQVSCSWATAAGAIGAGWDGSSCGSFPNGLLWGTGNGSSATYDNRSGTWSHWITWG